MANPKPVKGIILCLLWLFLVLVLTSASDPDLLQDFCVADNISAGNVNVNGCPCKDPKTVKATDFLFQGLRNEGSTNNMFGSLVTRANVETFPGLNTLGMSVNRVDFAPGGVNPPHFHPRATEIVFVVEGTILAGFITTNNTLFSQKLEKGDAFVVPRGLVHFQQNIGSVNAVLIAAFNSQLPGTQVLPLSLFGSSPPVPEDVLAKAFQISKKVVEEITSKFAPK